MRQILISAMLAVVTAWSMTDAYAEALPRWELGLGVAALSIPDYRGSDQQRGYLLPLPYIQYRGEVCFGLTVRARTGIYSDRSALRSM